MPLYLVTATVVKKSVRTVIEDGGPPPQEPATIVVQLPTFILHSAILGLTDVEGARRIAKGMLETIVAEGSEVSVDVYELDEVVGVGKVES